MARPDSTLWGMDSSPAPEPAPPADGASSDTQDPAATAPQVRQDPNTAKHSGLRVAFLPSTVELDSIEQPGGLSGEDLHCTLRYWGEVSDEAFVEQVHDAAMDIAANVQPFVVPVTGRRQLGQETPPADVLILGDSPVFAMARDRLPASDKDYPSFTPHVTVGYGIGEDALALAATDNDVFFDHIVVGRGNDDWTVYELGDLPPQPEDDGDVQVDGQGDTGVIVQPATAPVTAGIGGLLTAAKGDATSAAGHAAYKGGARKPGNKADIRPKGKHQICDMRKGGSPATCASVRWVSVYTALRRKGMTKEKAARIANSMHNHWKAGIPMRGHKRPMIRKTV